MNSMEIQRFVLNGRWVFDESTNQISSLDGSASPVLLAAVVTRLLGVLIRSPNEVFNRRRLFDEVWRRHGLEVGDNSLNQVIHGLRCSFELLGPQAPLVKTVPRVGYCLIAQVSGVNGASSVRHTSDQMVEPPTQSESDSVKIVAPARALLNPSDFQKVVDLEWRRAQRSGLPMSLLMISLDMRMGFVNDPIAVGQMIESSIAYRLRRPGDQAARYSPTEHAVLLPDTDRQGAAHVAQEIQRAIQTGERWNGFGPSPRVTMAIGHACTAQRRYASVDEWIEAARSALLEILSFPVTRVSSHFRGD